MANNGKAVSLSWQECNKIAKRLGVDVKLIRPLRKEFVDTETWQAALSPHGHTAALNQILQRLRDKGETVPDAPRVRRQRIVKQASQPAVLTNFEAVDYLTASKFVLKIGSVHQAKTLLSQFPDDFADD